MMSRQGGRSPIHNLQASSGNGSGAGGFTLLELMITIALISIVAAGLISAFTGQQESELSQEQVLDMQQQGRISMDIMVMHIRMAGYDPYDNVYDPGIKSAGGGLSSSDPLVFTYVADDDEIDNAEYDSGTISSPDGETDETGEIRTLTFYLVDDDGDGDMDLYMQTGNTSDDEVDGVIAENIDDSAAVFTYLDDSGDEVSDLDDIRAVEINLTTTVDAQDTDHTIGGVTRTLTTLVHCRNLGL